MDARGRMTSAGGILLVRPVLLSRGGLFICYFNASAQTVASDDGTTCLSQHIEGVHLTCVLMHRFL